MAQALQLEALTNTQNFENKPRIRAITIPRVQEELVQNIELEVKTRPTGQISVGNKVRHTRFLNINGPSGTYVIEISENKALCQYVDTFGKTRQVWFVLKDLVEAIQIIIFLVFIHKFI